jgi:Methyltransferase domain
MKHVSDYYGSACRHFGSQGWLASSWSSAEMQSRCFDNLLWGLGKHMHGEVLDVGCGQGDFYPLLKDKRPHMKYEGIDLCPEMIAYARHKYPGISVHMQDFMKDFYAPRADHVLASGTFNINIPGVDMNEYIRKSIAKMFECCTRSVAIDLSSSRKSTETEEIYYYDGQALIEYVFSLTNFVGFRQMPKHYGMALYLYKEEYDL